MSARYTTLPLPSYRFIPGKTPHPFRDPKGHSYGIKVVIPPRIDPENWATSEVYLFGADLFNAGYYWEAHETWEQLWKLEPPDSTPALFLQGLIQISAGTLKELLGTKDGSERLIQNGTEKLKRVMLEVGPKYMGINLDSMLNPLGQLRTLNIEIPDSER